MDGSALLKSFVAASGLPTEVATPEIERLIAASGKKIESLKVEDLRLVLSEYLQEVLLQACEEFALESGAAGNSKPTL